MQAIGLRRIAALLVAVLVGTSVAFAAQTPLDPVKVKQSLMKRGIGQGVKVVEVDGTHVVGIITAIRADNFDLTPKNTTQATTVSYSQVASLHNDSGNSTLAKVGKGIGIAAVVYIAIVVVAFVVVVAVAAGHG